MKLEFRKVRISAEIEQLVKLDRKIFGGDAFERDQWRNYEAWWLLLDGKKIGCCAFQLGKDFQKDPNKGTNPKRPGTLYIATTGILPMFQGFGFGRLMKFWQIVYARRAKFRRVVTNCRKSNKAIIKLNRELGFTNLMTVPKYYPDPEEATVVMELVLTKRSKRTAPR